MLIEHPVVFEEPEDPSNRSFFSEIISSISDVKFSHSGRYLMTRDYLTVKVWDLNMESKPLETYQVPWCLFCFCFFCRKKLIVLGMNSVRNQASISVRLFLPLITYQADIVIITTEGCIDTQSLSLQHSVTSA